MMLKIKMFTALMVCTYAGCFGVNKTTPMQVIFSSDPFGYTELYTERPPFAMCNCGLECLFCFGYPPYRRCRGFPAQDPNASFPGYNPRYELFENYNLDESEQNSLQAFLAEIKEKVYQPVGVESSLKGEIYPGKFIINTAAEEYIFSVSDNGKAFNPILGMIELNTEQPFSFVKDGLLYRVFSDEEKLPNDLFDLLKKENVNLPFAKEHFIGAKVVELITAVRNLQLSNLSDIHNWMSVIPFEIKRNLEEIYGYEKEKSASAFRYIIDQLENPNLKDYLANEKLEDPAELTNAFKGLMSKYRYDERNGIPRRITRNMSSVKDEQLLKIQNKIISFDRLRAGNLEKKDKLDKSCFKEWIGPYLPLKITHDLELISRFIYWLSVARENDLSYTEKHIEVVPNIPNFMALNRIAALPMPMHNQAIRERVTGMDLSLKHLTSILLDIVNRE